MRTNSQDYVLNNLTEINGISDSNEVNTIINQYPYWKQMYVSETLLIPYMKPDVETINSVDITANMIRNHVISTPRSFDDTGVTPVPIPNLEGKLLTGRKLIVEGQLCQKVVYSAALEEHSVHSAHFYVPFTSFIVVPKDIVFTNTDGTQTTEDACSVKFEVNICIEDVSVCVLDNRKILKQVTLMLYAVPTKSC